MVHERTGWRDDIEGLRAFAIVPVVLFHLDRAYAPGGFLGVDLFLVISGYLIARMLLTGPYLESLSGVRRFLRRRFLRIMPALAVTVALTALVFMWLAVPTHHTPFFFTGLASLFGASNLQLARLSTDYFAPVAGLNPFLHTWSVSVEDQFYLGIALALVVAARFAPERLGIVVLVGTLVAVEYALVNPPAPGSPAFFSVTLRAWEFLVGAAAFVLQERLARRGRSWPEWIRWLGFGAILYAIARGREGEVSAQYLVGAGGAVFFVRPGITRSALSDWLGHPLLRAIGRRSFALYLVHFPLLKLGELFADVDASNPLLGIAFLGVTAAVAELLHRGVERPYVESYRHPRTTSLRWRPRGGVLWAAAVAIVLLSIAALPRVSRTRGLLPRLARAEVRDYPAPGGHEVTLVGDSHAQQLFPAFIRLAAVESLSVRNRTMIGCLPSEELTFVRDGMLQQGCQGMVRDVVSDVTTHPRDGRVVMIAIRADAYLSDRRLSRFDRPVDGVADSLRIYPVAGGQAVAAYMASLSRLVEHLDRAGVPVLFLAPLPELRLPVYSCYFRRDRPACRVPRAEEDAYRSAVMRGLRELETRHPTFQVWDPIDALCPVRTCRHFNGDTLVFSDDNHLSAEMAVALAPSLHAAIRRTLATTAGRQGTAKATAAP